MWQAASTAGRVIVKAVMAFFEDDAPQMGAALAFYSTLSLAPLLIISLMVAALFVKSEAAEAALLRHVEPVVGAEGGKAIQEILKNSSRPEPMKLATTFSVVILLVGASGVFSQLQSAMNAIWDVPSSVTSGFWGMIRGRLISLAMVLATTALLLGTLFLSTAETAFQKQAGEWWTASQPLRPLISETVVFLVTWLLFALIFKYVPETQVAWRDVWFGAGVTALLFWIGKWLIGLYLATAALGSAYGAAGSLVVLLVWIYYSAQILFFGAELTYAFAVHRKSHLLLPDEIGSQCHSQSSLR